MKQRGGNGRQSQELQRGLSFAGKTESQSADLQRKFQPQQHAKLNHRQLWDEAFLHSLPAEMAVEGVAEQKRLQSIIIVASLLDRVPNLAGLTRTCEIFGAEALVLADLSVVRDPDFVGISVTAERHVNMRVSDRIATPLRPMKFLRKVKARSPVSTVELVLSSS